VTNVADIGWSGRRRSSGTVSEARSPVSRHYMKYKASKFSEMSSQKSQTLSGEFSVHELIHVVIELRSFIFTNDVKGPLQIVREYQTL
jgi:hypothetical protein